MRMPVAALVAVLLSATSAHAQADIAAIRATKTIEALRIREPIVIDGALDAVEGPVDRRGDDSVQDHAVSGIGRAELGDERVPPDSAEERIHVLVAPAAAIQQLQDLVRRPSDRHP